MHAIMFHHFHDGDSYHVSQGSINSEQLQNLINFYRENGFTVLPAIEWYEKAISHRLGSHEVAITFDDGLKCQKEIAAPVLKENGLTAFYFVPTQRFVGESERIEIFRDFRFSRFDKVENFYAAFFGAVQNMDLKRKNRIEQLLQDQELGEYLKEFAFYTHEDRVFRYLRNELLEVEEYNAIMYEMMKRYDYDWEKNEKRLYMSKEDIVELSKKGNLIGLHSHSHYTSLANASLQRQRQEYTQNKIILTEILKAPIICASYPCNSYNKDTLAVMRELDIKIGFRANMTKGFGSRLDFCREDHSNIIRRMKEENYSIFR